VLAAFCAWFACLNCSRLHQAPLHSPVHENLGRLPRINCHQPPPQVDAPLNNGVWGGPIFDAAGAVVGMAMQKSGSQAWVER